MEMPERCCVVIEWSKVLGKWAWEVKTPDDSAYGFEPTFTEAKDMAMDVMKEMGVGRL